MNKKTTYYSHLRTRLTAAFFILITLPILFVSWLTTYNFQNSAISNIETSAVRLVENRKIVINQYLKQKLTLLSTLAGIYTIEKIGTQEHLNSLFMAVNESDNIVDLHVIASSGDQIAYVGPYQQNIMGKKYNTMDWFKEVIASGRHVSDVFLGYRDTPHIVVAVTDPLKTYVLRATINSEIFNSLLFGAQVGPNGDAYIINRLGEFQTPSLRGLKVLPPDEKQFLEYREGTSFKIINSCVYTTTWMRDGKWLFIIKSRIEDSLGRFYTIRNNNLIIIFISSIIVLASAVILSRSMVDKLKQSDRKKAEMDQQMVQVAKMATIGRLAAGIAHEINNPLQMITNQAGWIEELLPEEDSENVKNLGEYRDAVKKIKHHVQRAGTITHRLLGFSRKMEGEKINANINELIEETVSFVATEASSNNILINMQLGDNLPTTMTDGPQLQQVLLNILNNGLDAIVEKGQIDIRTSTNHTTIFIEFADNGPGLSPEVMQQMFDPFYTTKEQGKGTGLGMSICYNIMQKLGGKIDIKNRKKRGAVFTLSLPVRKLGDLG